MRNKTTIAWLIVSAFLAASFGFFVGENDAQAAIRPCTASQSSAIHSQQNTVNQKQRTVNQDQQNYNNAQQKLNTANAKVNDLNAKRSASKVRIRNLLTSAAKNIGSPSVARGYKNQAEAEANNLKSIEQRLTWAQQGQKMANTDAANKLSKLSRSQRDLASAQENLATKRRACI